VVYIAAWGGGLRGFTDLAAKIQVNRDTAGLSCARLEERGWLQVVRRGSLKCPAPLIPRSCPPRLERRPIDVDGPYYQALVELGITCANEARSWTA